MAITISPPEDETEEPEESDLEEGSNWENKEDFQPGDFTIYSDDEQELTANKGFPSILSSPRLHPIPPPSENPPVKLPCIHLSLLVLQPLLHGRCSQLWTLLLRQHHVLPHHQWFLFILHRAEHLICSRRFLHQLQFKRSKQRLLLDEGARCHQRSHIQKILAFGYPACDYGYSAQAQYAATQVLIWEVIMRHRYSDINKASDYGLYYAVKSTLGNDLYYPYMAILGAIASKISNGKVLSFVSVSSSNPSMVNLTLNESTNCYEASVSDSNGVLSYFTFAQSGVTFTKSENALKISVPAASITSAVNKAITGTSNQKNMSTSNPSIRGNSTYQTVLTNGKADYMKAYIKLTYAVPKPKYSTLKLVKRVTDSSIPLSGWKFTIKNNRPAQVLPEPPTATVLSSCVTEIDITRKTSKLWRIRVFRAQIQGGDKKISSGEKRL